MLVIVAPGQGAQKPGFLTDWLALPDFATRFAPLAQITGLDLADLGTTGDADAIRDTAVAQPLLVATAIAAAGCLLDGATAPAAVSGHSVGELAAAAIAGALSDADATTLVRERGQEMAAAAALTPTGMSAVLGGDRDDVLARIAECGLTPANDNGPGQIVAAGALPALAALSEQPPAKARVTPLSVAGAFHTEYMQPAVARLEEAAAAVEPRTPALPVISNRDGEPVTDGAEVLTRIIGQVANPVRWDLCMEQFTRLGVTGLLELPPAGTLVGIARRGLKGVATFALKSPDQLAEARAFCAEHSGDPA